MFEVNDKMIEDIQTLIAKYPGNTKLRIKFLDLEEGIKIGLSTISKAVDLNNELLKELDGLHVGYSLN